MAGPIANEVVESLTSGEKAIPVKPTEPVPTYPGAAPPGAPPATPQPMYQVPNPNSWLGMSPGVARMFQFGAAGVLVLVAWLLIADLRSSGVDNQKFLVDAFQQSQKDRAEEVRTLTTGIMRTQSDLQGEIRSNTEAIRGLTRAVEKLEAKIDGRKGTIPAPDLLNPPVAASPTKGPG